MKSIVEKLKGNHKSLYFRTSAIRQFDNKRDKEIYKSIISHPMDLSNILRKLNNKKYNSYQEFYDDLNLIWDNAQTFNKNSSIIYLDAEYMRNYMEKIFKEKELNDKVIHKERIKKDEKEEENNEENEEENEEKNEEKNEDENYIPEKEDIKNKEINYNQNLKIEFNDEDFDNALIGKKRKKKKHRHKHKHKHRHKHKNKNKHKKKKK